MSPSNSKADNLRQVQVLVESSAVGVLADIVAREESADASLATEGDNIGRTTVSFLEVPVFVAPHLTSLAHTRLRLVHDEGNSLALSQVAEPLVEGGSRAAHIHARYWLDDNCSDVLACGTTLFDRLFRLSDAAVLSLGVDLLVASIGQLHLGKLSRGPVIRGHSAEISSLVTAAQSGD